MLLKKQGQSVKKLVLILLISFISVFGFTQTTEEQLIETTQALKDTTQALEDTTIILESTIDELTVAQAEIIILRRELEIAILSKISSMFQLGIGYTYPNGVEILFEVDIPNFFLGFYGRANIQFDNRFNLGIGLIIDL